MKSSHVIAIIGTPKSGKSSLALNLSAGLASEGQITAVIDCQTHKQWILTDHKTISSQQEADTLLETIEDLKKTCDVIILDVGSGLTDETHEHLEQCSAILVTTETSQNHIQKTHAFLQTIYRLHPRDLIYAILSRYHPKKSAGSPAAIKKQLGCNILGAVAEDTVVSQAAPLKPFVWSHPKSMASKYIIQLIKILHSKRILEKGFLIQQKRTQKVVSIHTKTSLKVPRAHSERSKPTVRPKLFSRFAKEELPRDPRTLQKLKVLRQLSSELNLKKLDTETGSDPKKIAVLRQKTRQAVLNIMEREKIFVGKKSDKDLFVKEVLDEALGLGPIEQLLADPAITEIMVNRKDQIYIEKEGKMILSDLTFTSDAQLLGIIERIVAPLGRRIDEKTPFVDARLPDGSRVHAIIPPLAIQGPTLTIRKFPEKNFTIQDLINFGSLNEEMADFFRAAIESRLNIIVSGGTGSGKTTLLNVLSSFIPEEERIVTVEDSAELRLTQPHVIRLESRPPNIEGSGAITIRDLVKNTLRMRPDRIVVGECRDGAALDMLQAMNTGHDGSLTTIHANSSRDCLARLETLVMMAGMDLPSRAIREQITSAINIVIQQARLSDGSRKIITISEITGMEGNVITTADIMRYKQTGLDHNGKVIGHFEYTEYVPEFIHELERKGLRIPKGFIQQKKGT